VNTLLLDTALWDLVLDANGNIAAAADPYSVVQDVASACKLFQGEYWYDDTIGVPYFQQILAQLPPLALIKAQLAAAASTVPGCTNPVALLAGLTNRTLTGQVQFTDSNGVTQVAGF
jgi:hypothetical protein